jgi:hypothetical protein
MEAYAVLGVMVSNGKNETPSQRLQKTQAGVILLRVG